MPPVKSELARLQFELSVDKIAEIDRLRDVGGFESRKDLLNNALTLMKWAIKHTEQGHSIAAVDEVTGKYYQLQMPFLSYVEPRKDRGQID